MGKPKRPVIILAGLAGSGKSTVSPLLAKRFKLRRLSMGDTVRRIAKDRGMDLIAYGRYVEKCPSMDRAIDKRFLDAARKGGVVIDSRVTAYLAKKAGLPAICVFLKTNRKVAAERVARRDHVTVAEAFRKSRIREGDLKRRLTFLYGLDSYGLGHYDAVIDTERLAPKEVVELIAQLVRYARH